MDRLFLDANVLFSAAYLPGAHLLQIWKLKNVVVCSSRYALAEANVNLDGEDERERLTEIAEKIQFYEAAPRELPRGISLPEKDAPILLAAIEARATHLLTGDVRDFGAYFGKKIAGVVIVLPGEYLRMRQSKRNDP
jgi:predicted nucleic acid-binding protein